MCATFKTLFVQHRRQASLELTCKQGLPRQHLGEYASGGPHVDGFGVVVGGQQQARRPVPFGHQSLREVALQTDSTETEEKEVKHDILDIYTLALGQEMRLQLRRHPAPTYMASIHKGSDIWKTIPHKAPFALH